MYGFIIHAHTRPERANDFEQLFRAYVEPSRAEPGCIEYHMLRTRPCSSSLRSGSPANIWRCILPCRICATSMSGEWST